jgi:murein DD-endopeptidase MepM/ murein hydrolase activator NlpD
MADHVERANKAAQSLGSRMKGVVGTVSSGGQKALGSTGGNLMADSLGGFTGGGGGTGGAIRSMMGAFGKNGAAMEATGGNEDPKNAFTMLSNVTSGIHQMLPDMGATFTRATEYYNATMYAGNRNPRATNGALSLMQNFGLAEYGMPSVQDMTLRTLNDIGGLTSVGADARVAKYLTGRGMNVANDPNSTYQQTLRTISHAGKYLNISNEAAAQSIEALTSAEGSSSMLRKFGIYTSDLGTGKEKTQGEIFEELAQRFTVGREDASIEDTLNSVRRGFLGQNIKAAFGNDQAGAEMFKQYMVERAGGSKMDLSDTGSMNKIYNDLGVSGAFGIGSGIGSGNANPMNSLYALNSSETNQLDKAEQSYIQGLTAAVKPLELLNEVSGTLAATLAGVNLAFLSTMQTSNSYKGGAKAAGATAAWYGGNVAELGKATAQFALGDRLGALATGFLPAMNLSAGSMGLGAMIGSGLLTTVAGGGLWLDNTAPVNSKRNPDNVDPKDQNKGGPDIYANQGGGSAETSIGLTASPIPGAQQVPGAGYNDKTGIYFKLTGRPHKGLDYKAPVGKAVYSVCDGKVTMAAGDPTRYYLGDKLPTGGVKYDGLAKNAKKSIGLGQQVHVLHEATGYTFVYGHLSKMSVSSGGYVKKGTLLGYSGNSGGTTGPHLHFECQDKNGNKIDPRKAIAQINAASLQKGAGKASASGSGSGSTSAEDNSSIQQMLATGASAATANSGFFGATNQQVAAIVAGLASGDMTTMQGAVNAMVNLANAKVGGGGTTAAGGTSAKPLSGGGGNTVNIEVKIPEVSDTEAARFAKLVKSYLDKDTLTSNMGSY